MAPADPGGHVIYEPGVSIELYETDESWVGFRELIRGQTPNVSLRSDRISIPNSGLGGHTYWYYVVVTGELLVEEPGDYQFMLTSDDGSMLEIDGELVITNSTLHGVNSRTGIADLAEGYHPLRVRMFQVNGGQTLSLLWRPPGRDRFTQIPVESLRTEGGVTRVVSPGPKRFTDDEHVTRDGDRRPLERVHPMWELATLDPKAPEEFELKVAGMAYLGGGRLALSVFDPRNNKQKVDEPNGKLWILNGVDGPPEKATVTLAAGGLINPLGVLHHEGALYVAQRDEITRFTDADLDDVYESRETVASGWVSDNYHHFTFGPVFLDGFLYATLSTSIGYGSQEVIRDSTFGTFANAEHRGSLMKIDPKTGDIDYIAGGMRTPNGLFVMDGELFVGENQGAWQPVNKINHLRAGGFYGHYNGNAVTSDYPEGAPPSDYSDQPVTPPAVYLPHGEIGNSPTDAVVLPDGPFKGHLLVSDVKLGGLRRVVLEKVNGEFQGVAFRHSQGFNCGLNRLALGDDGAIYCGGIGERSSWSWRKTRAGLQRLKPTGKSVFEFQEVSARPDGLMVRFTREVHPDVLADLSSYRLMQWRYRPTSFYGGPTFDHEEVEVTGAVPAEDGRSVRLIAPGVRSGRVVYLHCDIRDEQGEEIWSPEAWYTMNQLPGQDAPEPDLPLTRLLLFTKTVGYRHANIGVGVDSILRQCQNNGFDAVHTEDAAFFTDEDLARFDVVVFFSTTGDVLDEEQQAAFEGYIRGGGSFVGIHSATHTEHEWPWYNGLVGAQFAGHPEVQPAKIDVIDRDHPSTAHLPDEWRRTDEWYNFKELQDGLRVLMKVDESSYRGGTMGADHPIAWYQVYEGGRAWYTAGGHTEEAFTEPDFIEHIWGGILWAIGSEDEGLSPARSGAGQ